MKKLLQNQHSYFFLNSAYVYLLFSLLWFKCQNRGLPQLFQRKCYRYLIVCVELILPYFRETEMCVILKKLILLEGLSYWWASFNAKEQRWIFSNRLKNIPRNLSRIDFENENVHNASEQLRITMKNPLSKALLDQGELLHDAPVPEGTQRIKKRGKQKVNCEIKNESIIALIILKHIRPST